MVIKTIQGFDEVPESCSRCGCIMNEVYFRSKEPTEIWNAYNLAVLKCEKCDAYFAFWIQPFTYEPFFETPATEDEHMGGRTLEPPQWRYVGKFHYEGKQPRLPKETAKEYRRAVRKLNVLNKRTNHIIQDKLVTLYSAGVSNETINSARNRVIN